MDNVLVHLYRFITEDHDIFTDVIKIFVSVSLLDKRQHMCHHTLNKLIRLKETLMFCPSYKPGLHTTLIERHALSEKDRPEHLCGLIRDFPGLMR